MRAIALAILLMGHAVCVAIRGHSPAEAPWHFKLFWVSIFAGFIICLIGGY